MTDGRTTGGDATANGSDCYYGTHCKWITNNNLKGPQRQYLSSQSSSWQKTNTTDEDSETVCGM